MTMIHCERWRATLDDSHCGERYHCKGCPQCPEIPEDQWRLMKQRMGYGTIEGHIPERRGGNSYGKGESKWKYVGQPK